MWVMPPTCCEEMLIIVEVGEDKCGQDLESCTWKVFKAAFFEKYFPKSVRFQKENEFIQREQGNMMPSMQQNLLRWSTQMATLSD